MNFYVISAHLKLFVCELVDKNKMNYLLDDRQKDFVNYKDWQLIIHTNRSRLQNLFSKWDAQWAIFCKTATFGLWSNKCDTFVPI
jgi:hypothetical protein